MIKHTDIRMGGRKLARTGEFPPVRAKILDFPNSAASAQPDANRTPQTDGAFLNSDRPFAF